MPYHKKVLVKSTAGRASDLGNRYFRSRMERNYARYLERCVSLHQIDKWEYEPDTFWFEPIKRGVRSYTPDFKVFKGQSVWYIEVKGYLDMKAKTKQKRMAKYHPSVRVVLVDMSEYHVIEGCYSQFIPGWEK